MKVLKVFLAVVIILAAVIGGGMFYITRGLDSGSKQVINSIDVTSLGDGVYNGRYDSGRWTNEVNVTVKEHKIVGIEVVKDVAIPKPEWTKQLFDRVLEKQDTDVDVISGATVTSKAYLKSIENALEK